MPRGLPLLAILALVGAACSDDSTTSPQPVVTSTLATSTVGTSAAAATTSQSATSFTTSTTSPQPNTSNLATSVPPTVQSAGGWTLVVTTPAPDAAIGLPVVVCYEVTGTAREAGLELLVRVAPPDPALPWEPWKLPITVGRGRVQLDSFAPAPGTYDVEIGLIVDGTVLDAPPIEIPSVDIIAGSTLPSCD